MLAILAGLALTGHALGTSLIGTVTSYGSASDMTLENFKDQLDQMMLRLNSTDL